ncbi:piggyBac transposable element-derived protein 4-like [Oncorhynchus keta]|uniref:piggyBac transposable element-derived protein 4-like n=1 Tax=Oncorhynchus keta TaxID=8018 RepID=UPI00227CA402|nr:piggyBac transposable element-derived protein 4-like [Oncorhynchus keta]
MCDKQTGADKRGLREVGGASEQLVPFRGRCPFRQYMPSKPAKYGIKIWVACDAQSSYAWKMPVYTGKPTSGGPEKNQGMRVVFDVTDGLRGHNPELSPALLATRGREAFSSKFAFTPTTTLVSYLPKRNKNVVLLSTLHKTAEISDREDRKQAIILDYNHNKGGVDNLEKGIGTYSCRRMTDRWPLVLFPNIIDVTGEEECQCLDSPDHSLGKYGLTEDE